MLNKGKGSKTKYCKYYLSCDRDENCFDGESCPVFRFNPDCARKQEIVESTDFESIMDDI